MTAFPIELAPVELQKKIVSFLDIKDAFGFSLSSRNLQQAMSLSTVHLPVPLLTNTVWTATGEGDDIPRKGRSIPLLMKNRVHSVVLRCRWRDQGWGNKKGKLYVVAAGCDGPVRGGRVLVESPVAQHVETELRMDFNVSDSESYYLWYKVGDGVGHSLTVRNLTVQLIIHDRQGMYLSKNFNAMRRQGALRNERDFHFQMLQVVTNSLLDQLIRGGTPDINLTDFFESTGIAVNKQSLEALIELTSSLLELGNQMSLDDEEEGPSVISAFRQDRQDRLPPDRHAIDLPLRNDNPMDDNGSLSDEFDDDMDVVDIEFDELNVGPAWPALERQE